MLERISQRKYVFIFATVVVAFYAVTGILYYWMDNKQLLKVFYWMFGALMAYGILGMATGKEHIKPGLSQILLLIYLGWYLAVSLLTTLATPGDWVLANESTLIDSAVCILVAYPMGVALGRGEGKKTFRWMIHVFILCWTVLMIYTLIHIFQGESVKLPSGRVFRMSGNSLLLSCNRNTTGLWGMVFFLGSVYMALTEERIWSKTAYSLAAAVSYVVLVLSNSRSSLFGAGIGWAAMTGIVVYLKLEKKKEIQRILWALGGAAVAGTVFFVLWDPVFALYRANVKTATAAARDVMNTGGQLLSGREQVWPGFLKGWTSSFQRFVVGVTPAGCTSLIEEMSNGELSMYTHNQFLEVAVDTGLIGLGIFGFWLLRVLRDCWRMVIRDKERSLKLCIPVLIIVLLAVNMFEATLLFYRYMTAYLFFILCGMVDQSTGKGHQRIKRKK